MSTRKRASAALGLRPWWGMAPWAILPRKSTRSRSAPLAVLHTSPASGSQQMAPSTPVSAAGGHEVLGAEHHALLVDERGEHDATGERAGVGHLLGGEEHGGHAGLHVGRAPPVQPAVDDLGAERIDRPRAGVALGHDVGVALEQQRGAGPAAVDRRRSRWAGRGRPRRARAPSRRTASWPRPAAAAGSSRRPVAGSWTLGMRTSSWVKAMRASRSIVIRARMLRAAATNTDRPPAALRSAASTDRRHRASWPIGGRPGRISRDSAAM